jgi:hypothetical protein
MRVNQEIERDLERELIASDVVRQHCRDDVYAQNLYAALCNMRWQPTEVWPMLKDELWSCSWRHAGAVVAQLRNSINTGPDGIADTADYLDWYCSGIIPESDQDDAVGEIRSTQGYVSEGTVTDQIRQDLAALGWHPVPWPDEDH